MRQEDFRRCCQAVEEGEEVFLENIINHKQGKILFCTGEEFQVKVDDKRVAWTPETCEEASSSSESPHENI